MITHVIYHIVGRKVGCCADLMSRKSWYPKDTTIEVVEELYDKSDQEAGDIEWQWADRFGYDRGVHYAEIKRRMSNRGPDYFSEMGRKVSGFRTITMEQRIENGLKGARRTAELGLSGLKNPKNRFGGNRQRAQCPHCGMESNLMILKRWHFDKCPRRLVNGND